MNIINGKLYLKNQAYLNSKIVKFKYCLTHILHGLNFEEPDFQRSTPYIKILSRKLSHALINGF